MILRDKVRTDLYYIAEQSLVAKDGALEAEIAACSGYGQLHTDEGAVKGCTTIHYAFPQLTLKGSGEILLGTEVVGEVKTFPWTRVSLNGFRPVFQLEKIEKSRDRELNTFLVWLERI